ncbi:hypothetical protein ACFLVX_04580 [Chloroflexota bacterium]
MALVKTISQYWLRIQSSLFPWLEEELGEMTGKSRPNYQQVCSGDTGHAKREARVQRYS